MIFFSQTKRILICKEDVSLPGLGGYMCMLSSACRLSLFSWFEHILFGIDYTIGSGTSHVKRPLL